MRGSSIGLICLSAAMLASCDRSEDYASGRAKSGRYQGIGITTPGEQWTKIAAAPKPGDDKHATLEDDDYVVFVTDSQSGEVRECGNRSGFCVRFQPWQHPAPPAPLVLTDHAHKDAPQDAEDRSAGNAAE